jgi:hypothetical protein
MTSFRADLALLGVSVVGVLSDLACVLLGHTPPDLFSTVALTGLVGAAGVTTPLGSPNTQRNNPQLATATQGDAAAADTISGPVGA